MKIDVFVESSTQKAGARRRIDCDPGRVEDAQWTRRHGNRCSLDNQYADVQPRAGRIPPQWIIERTGAGMGEGKGVVGGGSLVGRQRVARGWQEAFGGKTN